MNELLKVKIIAHTPNPEGVVAQSAKLCYSKVGVDEIMEKMTNEKIEEFVEKLVSIGHESPLEHVSFTFAVEGIDRSVSHQLVRHRVASFSQQSQRYVDLNKTFQFTTPNVVKDMDMQEEWAWDMRKIHDLYLKWQTMIKEHVEKTNYPTMGMTPIKVANENARGMLPNACETKMVFTMNARELLHFFDKRCCNRAQEGIRELAWEMLRQVKEIAPILFKNAGSPCLRGKCPEGSMACGVPYKKECNKDCKKCNKQSCDNQRVIEDFDNCKWN